MADVLQRVCPSPLAPAQHLAVPFIMGDVGAKADILQEQPVPFRKTKHIFLKENPTVTAPPPPPKEKGSAF